MALSSLFLAAKLEEHELRLRDLINVFHFISKRVEHEKAELVLEKARAKARNLTDSASSLSSKSNTATHHVPKNMSYTPMDYFDKLFYDMKEEAVIGEMQLLKRCVLLLLPMSYFNRP